MHLSARRPDAHPSSLFRTRSGPPQAADRSKRRARPQAEALDSRLLMTAGNPSPADATASSQVADQVAQVVKPYLDQNEFPGVSVAVVTDGHIALATGYGTSNVATGAAVEGDTRFDIGSVTKTFTALAVLILYQESQGTSHPLDLNAPIGEYLHNTKSFKLPRQWSHITTMELLNMTSGIKEVEDARPWQVQLNSIAKAPLRFTPGTATSYSDPNYYLLGELIEQWTGQTYATFIQNQILDPLGMSQTEELGRSAQVSNQAVGYNAPRHGKWPKTQAWTGSAMYAAAGMVSTAHDMALYMEALLSGRLLNAANYALMWTATPSPQFGSNPPTFDVRGLGWDSAIDMADGPVEVTKGGDVNGYTSELILYPSTDSGVFVSFNTSYAGPNPSSATALQLAESVYAATQSASPSGG
jgi:CubicO group peptidase (beta-lactamase class C family)